MHRKEYEYQLHGTKFPPTAARKSNVHYLIVRWHTHADYHVLKAPYDKNLVNQPFFVLDLEVWKILLFQPLNFLWANARTDNIEPNFLWSTYVCFKTCKSTWPMLVVQKNNRWTFCSLLSSSSSFIVHTISRYLLQFLEDVRLDA